MTEAEERIPEETVREWRDEAERFFANCIRFDFSCPCYVVLASEIPEDFRAERLGGCTGPYLDLILQPYIGDRWLGRGPTIMVNDDTMIAGGYSMPRDSFRATVIHEIAHVVESFQPGVLPPGNEHESIANATREFAEWTQSIAAPSVPFERHGWGFIRMAAHVFSRAERLDFGSDLPPAAGWYKYRLSMFEKYRRALLAELEGPLNTGPFHRIRESPLPTQFANLWRSDFLQWIESTDHPPSEALAEYFIPRSLIEQTPFAA